MENQITKFIQCLESKKLSTYDFHEWTDQQSGVYSLRASFADGEKFEIYVAEQDSAQIIKHLTQNNLQSQYLQMKEFEALCKLEKSERYTIASMSDFGFCNSTQFTLEAVRFGRYAQYGHCLELIVKPKGKRLLRSIRFYNKKSFALCLNWISVCTDPFGPATRDDQLTVSKSRYPSCDERYLADAIASVSQKPLITNQPSTTSEKGKSND